MFVTQLLSIQKNMVLTNLLSITDNKSQVHSDMNGLMIIQDCIPFFALKLLIFWNCNVSSTPFLDDNKLDLVMDEFVKISYDLIYYDTKLSGMCYDLILNLHGVTIQSYQVCVSYIAIFIHWLGTVPKITAAIIDMDG